MSENLHITACTFTGWMYGVKYVRMTPNKYHDGVYIANAFFDYVFYGLWLSVPSDLQSIADVHITNTEIHAKDTGSTCLYFRNVADIHISNSHLSVTQDNSPAPCIATEDAPAQACIYARQVAGMQISSSRFHINDGYGVVLMDSDLPVRNENEEINCRNYVTGVHPEVEIIDEEPPTDCLGNVIGCIGVTVLGSTFTGTTMLGAVYLEQYSMSCVVQNNARFEHCDEYLRAVKMSVRSLGNVDLTNGTRNNRIE
jgi:hypothetical protein